ncbi:MAG: hybrid sensor histidine kinase/response regulator [Desulfuromonadales bacterium]
MLVYNLRNHVFTTLIAHDGLTGCRLAGAERPDLILLDILLPDLDGWEICKLVRGHPDPEMATTPIIMLTALGSRDDRLKGLELGADAYIPKPYSMKEVLISARRLIEKRWRQSVMAGEIAVLKNRAALQADLQNMLFHELRNQMVVIQGFSTLLGKNLRNTALEKPADYADAICRSSEYLGNLAEEFLLAGKFESGTLELPVEVLDLGRVLKETLELYQPLAHEKGISVHIENGTSAAPARLNHAAVRLVISNLLDNAIKYSPRKSSVKVGLQWEADGHITVRVEDRGPGINAGEAELIFNKFFRGSDTVEKSRGSGLGLYLAKTLTEAMGGSIEVKSLPGEGSCFTARFPAWKAGEETDVGKEKTLAAESQ